MLMFAGDLMGIKAFQDSRKIFIKIKIIIITKKQTIIMQQLLLEIN